eukprot:TRINITY_DN15150_c0_g1_i1.p1 TRINITY_DN15150_c0_g1~~TRINITY_DN15150_c0_g1_i1.p1  ORF type:complete len:293 (-),score=69.07 TRINITY_DN15150_c0_g1_i1:131-1009(-)
MSLQENSFDLVKLVKKTSTSNKIGTGEYWDEIYKKCNEVNVETFDWYNSYDCYSNLIEKYIKKTDNILIAGCGNSTFNIDLYNNGYKNVVGIDISLTVIKQMKLIYPHLTWFKMDAVNLDFQPNTFNVCIDKGTLDAILCSSFYAGKNVVSEVIKILIPTEDNNDNNNVDRDNNENDNDNEYINIELDNLVEKEEIKRVESKGIYILITNGSPFARLELLSSFPFKNIDIYHFNNPSHNNNEEEEGMASNISLLYEIDEKKISDSKSIKDIINEEFDDNNNRGGQYLYFCSL